MSNNIIITESDKKYYGSMMINYKEVFYLEKDTGLWYNDLTASVSSGENQLLSRIYKAATYRKPIESKSEIDDMLGAVVQNIIKNGRVQLNGTSYILPTEKLKQIIKAIDDDVPNFWRINFKGSSIKRLKKYIKDAIGRATNFT